MADGTGHGSSAELISFPGRFRPPIDGPERLDRAVRALEQANRELRDAVAAWRGAIEALSFSVGGIAVGLQALDAQWMAVSAQLPTPAGDAAEHGA